MCLIIRASWKPKTAKKDITVYKRVHVSPSGELRAPFRNQYVYILNKILYADFTFEQSNGKDMKCLNLVTTFDFKEYNDHRKKYGEDDEIRGVMTGFHSSFTKKRLGIGWLDAISKVAKCIIPSGAKYYTNCSGLACSNQIKLLKIIE